MRSCIVPIMLLLVAACAHERPFADANCLYTAYPLKVPVGELAAADALGAGKNSNAKRASPFYEMMSEALEVRRKSAGADMGAADEVLALSGGSQNGAFGAGFFLGLSESAAIPKYDIVTGVSTGALQSTFLFLATSPVPTDRRYPDDIGYSQDGPDAGVPGGLKKIKRNKSWASDLAIGFSIRDERALLRREDSLFGEFGAALIEGSAATLAPLEDRLGVFLTPETLRQIAGEHGAGRMLFAGVTGLDDGEGYAIDLGDLASSGLSPEILRRCYARALIASSTVPLGAPPVTLGLRVKKSAKDEGRIVEGLFIDGGARYALFLDDVLRLANEERSGVPLNVTAIVNGVLFPRVWTDDNGNPVDKWDILNVGLRSIDILQNQVTQFSLDAVEAPRKRAGQTRIAYIGATSPGFDDPLSFKVGDMTCAAWRRVDIADQNPFEFFPRYMRCILEYGRSRGAGESWNKVIERP